MGIIFPRQPRYDFFDMMHGRPDWSNATILDIGGNRGNLLEDLIDLQLISPQQYTSLDVDQEGLDFGKMNNPDANWVKHEAFNHAYNEKGHDEHVQRVPHRRSHHLELLHPRAELENPKHAEEA